MQSKSRLTRQRKEKRETAVDIDTDRTNLYLSRYGYIQEQAPKGSSDKGRSSSCFSGQLLEIQDMLYDRAVQIRLDLGPCTLCPRLTGP